MARAKRPTGQTKKVSREWVIDQAETMLTAFEDVGVSKFDLTLATEKRQAAEFVPGITIAKLRRALPSLFDRNEREWLNFIIRPRFGRDNRLVQLDDLDATKANKILPYSFLAIETSLRNYQVWLAFQDRDADFARRLKKGVGADTGASGAVKIAGSVNIKAKYAPNYPRVQVVHIDTDPPYANAEKLEQIGMVAAPISIKERLAGIKVGRPPNAWPDYQRCVAGAPMASHGGKDISRADFTWAKIALEKFRWIHQPDRVAEQLFLLSPKAQDRADTDGMEYCRMTVESALRAILEKEQ
jgi:hypothetical protein